MAERHMSKFGWRELCTQGTAWKQSQAVLRMSDEQMGGDVVVCNVANIMMVMKMEISSDSSGHNQTEMKAKIGR